MGSVADAVGLVGQVMMRTRWRKKGAQQKMETPSRLVMAIAPSIHKCCWPMGHPISRQLCSDVLEVKQGEKEHVHIEGALSSSMTRNMVIRHTMAILLSE